MGMLVGTLEIKLYASHVHSLKEKRMIVKSMIGKIKSRFNVAISEIAEQDRQQTIIIGVACISDSVAGCDKVLDHILDFIDENVEAELTDIVREIR